MRAIVTGMIATYPVGGVAWDYGQYALGLERLGWDVYYLEDTGLASYHPSPAKYLSDALTALSPSLQDRWHYRTWDGTTYGLTGLEFSKIVRDADLFLNVSGGCLLRDSYMMCPRKVFIDTDPGLNHFVNFPKWDNEPGWQGTHGYRAHDVFFTYATNLGSADCILPNLDLRWHTTFPPVVLACWKPEPPAERWTTVMSWNPYQHYRQPIEYLGITYGAKEAEFERIEGIPMYSSAQFEIAVGGSNIPQARWEELGWCIVSADLVSDNVQNYRKYIQSSRGEFSVAKNVYVATHSGWFSCRSVCYLAAGRPVVTQDTGFSAVIPTGNGLFAFADLEQAVASIEAVERDYAQHQRAALAMAHEYFAAERVLGDLLAKAGI